MSKATSTPLKLSLQTARTLAVIKQGLHRRPATTNKQALLDAIRQIGLLQLDTINVVARSHYLVILSRVGLYDPADLDALLYPDRSLFEHWGHAACLIPGEDYAYFAPLILARRERPTRYRNLDALGDDPQAMLDFVLAEVRERGPVASRDFDVQRGKGSGWWDYKWTRHVLAILHDRGYVMVDRRVNFQLYYDLSERVLPAGATTPSKTIEDFQRWAIRRSVTRLGVATAGQVSDYYRRPKPATRATLNTLEAEGAVMPVEVEGWNEKAYLDPADAPLVAEIAEGAHRPALTTFLSPFDNLTWNRQRLADLFGFDYRLEIYVPAAKRKYGYYVMPILHQGRFVGRLDPKADRAGKRLIIHNIYLEAGEVITADLLAGMAAALREFMVFHNCQSMTIANTEPKALKEALLERIDF